MKDRSQIYSCTVIHIGILWPSQHIIEIKIILPENESSDLKGCKTFSPNLIQDMNILEDR